MSPTLPRPRGAISSRVIAGLAGDQGRVDRTDVDLSLVDDPLSDPDLHVALHVLYELHYRGFEGVADELEWDPSVLGFRRGLEAVFESGLRSLVADRVADALESIDDVVAQIRYLIDQQDGPDVARFVHREATVDQFRALLVQRSIHTLRESDPSSFLLPRVEGAAKVALAELQYDEYGAGRPDRLHAHLFARAMAAADLDSSYGAYVNEATGETLAMTNAMSLFALHRRLRGAGIGHLAAFEATSTVPCRKMAAGIRRLELDSEVSDYFDEHVEADAVHEEIALRDIAARAVANEPAIGEQVLFGAATCLHLDAAAAEKFLAPFRKDGGRVAPSPPRVPA